MTGCFPSASVTHRDLVRVEQRKRSTTEGTEVTEKTAHGCSVSVISVNSVVNALWLRLRRAAPPTTHLLPLQQQSTWTYNGLPAIVRGRQRVVEGGGSDPSSGPRRLVSAPVAVHLLPGGEGNKFFSWGAACAQRAISLSAGERGDRKAGGEGLLSRILRYRLHGSNNRSHELVRVFQHHRVWDAQ